MPFYRDIPLRGNTPNGDDITLQLQIDLNFDENTKLEGFKKQYTKYLPKWLPLATT